MKKIILIAAIAVLAAVSADAQVGRRYYVDAGWQFNGAFSNNFSENASGWGGYIEGGYYFLNDIEIISEDDARNFDVELVRLKGICNHMQRYNTKAKMRNIDWSIDVVKTAMTETRSKVFETLDLMKELDGFRDLVSYLRIALSNVNDKDLKAEITSSIDGIKEVINKGKQARDAYKLKLEALKDRYATWYMEAYLKAHISEIDHGKKNAVMLTTEKQLCDIIKNASFINPSRYDNWLRNAILSVPTSVDGFNPAMQKDELPELEDLKDELKEIYAEYEQGFRDVLEDPTILRNKEMLTQEEKSTIQQFIDGNISLNPQYARILIDIINKLQRSFTKVEINHNEMLKIFSRPMTKQQALDALATYIDNQSRGHKPEDIRIIVK